MALADKQRWDHKYKDKQAPQIPSKLLSNYAELATGKQALDIACGMGRHSKYLAALGFEVDALDISSLAIASLQDIPNVHAMEVDFDTYILAKKKYDLIVCTYFLERKLFPQIVEALNTNGIILFETFLAHKDNEKSPSNPAFILQEGELETYFTKTCKLLHLKKFWDVDNQGFKCMKISMLAKLN